MAPRKKLSAEELKFQRDQASFTRRIRSTFTNAGFTYVPTRDHHRQFGNKAGELDSVFIYKNIVLVCEDTIATSHIREHLKDKAVLFGEVAANPSDTMAWLKTTFPDRFSTAESYDDSRYKFFFLYFSKHDIDLSDADSVLFQPLRHVDVGTLNYLNKMAQNIKFSSRADIFRFLGLQAHQIGMPASSTQLSGIEASIIYPTDSTGLKGGVRLVSFMMNAEVLLKNSYVLRKDSWQDATPVYQRLIEKQRIQSIRKYLAANQTAFLNNIIVSLPKGISFQSGEGESILLKDIDSFAGHKMLIPDRLNSICIIDGQHRVYAHYEGNDGLETKIAPLRKKVHLLVTGLVFPANMAESQRIKFESQVFLDINSTAKKVPADVILYIETVKDPYSDVGIARKVLERLNRTGVFKGKFQLSLMVDAPIKTASIIRFALRNLVELTDDLDKDSLFLYWAKGDATRSSLVQEQNNDDLLNEYIDWLVTTLNQYFGAVRAVNKADWDDPASRILSTTAINGHLIALRRSWRTHGIQDFPFYQAKLQKLSTQYSKDAFGYTSSQYAKFSRIILSESFEIQPDLDES